MSEADGRRAMDRRAFLRMSLRGKERVLELSCERLHVRWVDACARVGSLASRAVPAFDPWEGEPPLDVVAPDVDELLAELEGRLTGADVLRVRGREWLARADLRAAVESRIEAFRLRGGRVE